jgi:hypothetical protein
MYGRQVRNGRAIALTVATAAFLALGVSVGAGEAAAASGPPGCPKHDVVQGPIFWDYTGESSLGGGLYQRRFDQYYLATFVGRTSCTGR